jgi:hypothetical protein
MTFHFSNIDFPTWAKVNFIAWSICNNLKKNIKNIMYKSFQTKFWNWVYQKEFKSKNSNIRKHIISVDNICKGSYYIQITG